MPTLEQVKEELHTIRESPVFSHSTRQTQLLEYLCNKVLLGEAGEIKAATIAMEVFKRPWDFDETKDAIVRVEAHRLRKKLSQYYANEGARDKVRIVLTPGGYVPEFVENGHGEIPAEAPPDSQDRGPAEHVGTAVEEEVKVRGNGRFIWLVLSALGVVAAVGLFLQLRGFGSPAKTPAAAPEPVVAGTGLGTRILAGFNKGSYTDRFGRTWGADRYFQGGTVEPGPKEFYGKPPDGGLFTSMRVGEFSYDIPTAPGYYQLRLYWAEPIFRSAAENNGDGENERRFHVSLNGAPLLQAFDVVADSGMGPVAIRAFKDVQPDRDGMVHIRFTAGYGTPFVNAIELLPAPKGRALPVRIRAHELSFNDRLGNSWSSDDYFIGGRLATHKQPVTGTDDPELYAGERYGSFAYAIPVPPGSYRVTMHFAETWFHPDSTGQDKGGAGIRNFNVYCNGATLVKSLDIFAEAGYSMAIKRTFHGIQPNGQGKILLTFAPNTNYASVKAIEVVEE